MSGIGLFGGTFDPIHQGHLFLCRAFYEALGLDRVVLIPTVHPPHKPGAVAASFPHRLAMCRLAAASLPFVEVDDLEFSLNTSGFFVEVVREYARRYPGIPLYLLCGADTFLSLSSWYQAREVLRMVTPCTVMRPGAQANEVYKAAAFLERWQVKPVLLDLSGPDISSSDVRQCLEQGQDPGEALAPPVMDYIRTHHLYIKEGHCFE
jgi:nicotinate-nucleotide adenylyltransferase